MASHELFSLCQRSETFRAIVRSTAAALHGSRPPDRRDTVGEWVEAEGQVYAAFWRRFCEAPHLAYEATSQRTALWAEIRWATIWDDVKDQLRDDPEVRQQVERRAYALYEERGSRAGNELDDWMQAEYEVLQGYLQHFAAEAAEDRKRRLNQEVASWGGS